MDPLLIFTAAVQTSKKETISSWEKEDVCSAGMFCQVIWSRVKLFIYLVLLCHRSIAILVLSCCIIHRILCYNFFFQIRHSRLISGGLFWESVLVTKGCLAGQVVQCKDLLLYWLFLNCCWFVSSFFLSLKQGQNSGMAFTFLKYKKEVWENRSVPSIYI